MHVVESMGVREKGRRREGGREGGREAGDYIVQCVLTHTVGMLLSILVIHSP